MTDYAEEQRNELEALESIYADSFTVLSTTPTSFSITVTSEAGENEENVQVTIKFSYVESYPDEAPVYEIVSQENLECTDTSSLLSLLKDQAQENLGMVMIFTLVSAVQDKLNEIVDQIKTRKEEEKVRKEKEAEEAEKVRFHGTPVTIENFLSWKAKFDAEVCEMKKKRQKEEEQSGKNKLTGLEQHVSVRVKQISCHLKTSPKIRSTNIWESSCLKQITIWIHQISSFWKKPGIVLKWMNRYSRNWMI
ncbi:hypothetical protein XENTR_v10014057 [Xenopus tropicalis]|nr:hypothetical protein XENTR_v10014057 [Xenopus tropicalis]